MAGRQIRWPGVGRVAVIGAAVIAAIAALPALMGSDRPPPVPEDVGLLPAPSASVPEPLPPRAPLPRRVASDENRLGKGNSETGDRSDLRERLDRRNSRRTRQRGRNARQRGRDTRQRGDSLGDQEGREVTPESPPVYLPSYAPPQPSREFRIEP